MDDMARQSDRFGGDLKNRLDKPMLELVRQIPRVAGRATLRAAGPGQYELLWQVRDKARYHNTMLSVVQQIQVVWRDYMNLSVSAAVSDLVTEAGVADACALCGVMVRLAVLQGTGSGLHPEPVRTPGPGLPGQSPCVCAVGERPGRPAGRGL